MKIQIVSGFLGSGKTTFLNRYLTCLQGSVAVIENEFGPAGLDAQLLGEEVPVKEISAGRTKISPGLPVDRAFRCGTFV